MDPRDNSESFRNNSEINCEGKSNRNSKGTPKPSDHGDDVFTPMPNQSESNSVPLNGTLLGYLNSLPSNDNNQQSLKLSENSTDPLKNSSSASHSQMCNKINSNHFDQPEPSSSNRPEACDKGLDTEPQSCQRHRVCLDKAVNKYNGPSTSGTNKSCDNFDNCTVKENRKRPSSLRLNRHHFDDEDSSSDTGNDDYSLGSEDGCIYTYRGGEHLADLPSSFFSLDMGLPLDKHLPLPPNYVVRPEGAANNREQRSRASSPDMDFLEMDFDPGPSCDADTGEDSSPDIDLEDINEIPEENFAVAPPREVTPEGALVAVKGKSPTLGPVPGPSKAEHQYYDLPSISGMGAALGNEAEASASTSTSQDNGPYITHVNVRGERLLVKRTMAERMPVASVSQHVSSGDLVSPRELLNHEEELPDAQFSHQINQGERPTFDPINLSATLYHLNMAKRLMREKTAGDVERHIDNDLNFVFEPPEVSEPSGVTAVPRSMVWSEREAAERQVTQIATSACGATAVVNVFIALGVPVNVERINAAVGTRQRANHAPLPRYLLSRAVAGCTAADLVSGIQKASDGSVTARFFPTYPERVVSLSHWLADWISLGAIPILTLNLQVGCEGEIPDAWHHQMVFGVSRTGVYLCNPVERVAEAALWPRLASPSVLLVRTRDVLSRFTPRTDLTPLMAVPDRRFYTANVLGQVVNVIREWRATGWSESGIRTRHIRLPCAYQAGVTIAALTGSEAHRRLMHATNLPLLGDTASGWQ